MTQVIRLDTIFSENTGNAKVLTALGNPYFAFHADAYTHLSSGDNFTEFKANGLARQPKTSFTRAGGSNNVCRLYKDIENKCYIELVGTTFQAPIDIPLEANSITLFYQYQTDLHQKQDSIRLIALKQSGANYNLTFTPLNSPRGNFFGQTVSPSYQSDEFAKNVLAVHVKRDGTLWVNGNGVTSEYTTGSISAIATKFLQIGGSTAKLDSTVTTRVRRVEVYTDLDSLTKTEFEKYINSLD